MKAFVEDILSRTIIASDEIQLLSAASRRVCALQMCVYFNKALVALYEMNVVLINLCQFLSYVKVMTRND